MNIASLQTLLSGPQQVPGNGKQIGTNPSTMAFGSVLNNITQSGAAKLHLFRKVILVKRLTQ